MAHTSNNIYGRFQNHLNNGPKNQTQCNTQLLGKQEGIILIYRLKFNVRVINLLPRNCDKLPVSKCFNGPSFHIINSGLSIGKVIMSLCNAGQREDNNFSDCLSLDLTKVFDVVETICGCNGKNEMQTTPSIWTPCMPSDIWKILSLAWWCVVIVVYVLLVVSLRSMT